MKVFQVMLLSLVVNCVAQTVSAQDNNTTMVMNTFSVVSAFSLPPWESAKSFGKASEFHRQQGKTPSGINAFIWEAIPKGQTFDNWTQLYAVFAQYPIRGRIQRHVQEQIGHYKMACIDVAVQETQNTPMNTAQFVVFCSSYTNAPDMGEVAFFNLQLIDTTLVKNYFHQKVPSFSIENGRTNPKISAQELISYRVLVSQLMLSPRS
ncbi:MAG: hypothetical protein GDA36_08810 [Rhodobacteraceae bacterium]|nr:hypothetical protein [Paracoccaceae bacterium]